MPVDIHNMRSEVSIQPESGPVPSGGGAENQAMDPEQLREAIRDIVMEIIGDDIYTLFRTRGKR